MASIDKLLKQEILEKAGAYYLLKFKIENKLLNSTERINYAQRIFDQREIKNLVDSALEFWLTYGRYSKKFERDFSKYLKVKFALLVNSGSSANLLAFMALTSPLLKERRIKRGDEVITVAAAFPTTVAPIVQYGAVPVFVDIDPQTINIDTSLLKKAISSKTKAVMIAHTLGNPFNIEAVKKFCDKNNLWLVEDNCDALGSKYKNKYTGTWGDIGTSSFYAPHHITMGEGGALYTNNPWLKKIILSLRDWGRDCWCDSGKDNTCKKRFSGQYGKLPFGYDHKFVYSHFGYNLKATDLQAAIGCAQLKKLPGFIKRRRANYDFLRKNLRNLKKYFYFQEKTPYSQPSWFGFLITLKDNQSFSRNEIVEYLEKNNIQTRNLFAGNLVKQPVFSSLKKGKDYRIIDNLDNTDRIMHNSFWVGIHPGLGRKQLKCIIKHINEFSSSR